MFRGIQNPAIKVKCNVQSSFKEARGKEYNYENVFMKINPEMTNLLLAENI